MSGEPGAGYQAIFRERWRERQSAGNRLGGLVRQPGWVDAALIGLGIFLAAGAVAASTVTVERTLAFPAVVDDSTVSAVLGSAPAPAVGSPAQFRTTTTAVDAVVVDVTTTEVIARLSEPAPASAGQLLLPAGRQRLVEVLAPRLG